MTRLIFALLFFLVPGTQALAGAWARPQGEVFLSFSHSLEASIPTLRAGVIDPAPFRSFYAEAGLGHRLTFGFEVGGDSDSFETMALLRRTITAPETPLQVALDLGLGRRHTNWDGDHDLLRLGLSLGHGISAEALDWLPGDFSGGWMGLEAHGIRDLATDTLRWKAEATLGLTLRNGDHLILQAMAEDWSGAPPAYAISPSYVRQLGPSTALQLGARFGFGEDASAGITLALWHRF